MILKRLHALTYVTVSLAVSDIQHVQGWVVLTLVTVVIVFAKMLCSGAVCLGTMSAAIECLESREMQEHATDACFVMTRQKKSLTSPKLLLFWTIDGWCHGPPTQA